MPEKEKVYEETLKQKGPFPYRDLYNFCYNMLREDGYDVYEEKYEEKVTPGGKDIVIKWTAKKKISDYFRNVIEAKWRILGMQDIEIQRNGKKEKTNTGEVKIAVKGILERDYEDRWATTPLYKWMRGIYDRYIIKTVMDQYEEKLTGESDEFVEQTKSFLQLEGKK